MRIMETSVRNLRHREVGQLDLTDCETRLCFSFSIHTLTEKRELISVLPTVVPAQIPREIPPLCFEVGVRMVVSWKLVLPTWQGYRPLFGGRLR